MVVGPPSGPEVDLPPLPLRLELIVEKGHGDKEDGSAPDEGPYVGVKPLITGVMHGMVSGHVGVEDLGSAVHVVVPRVVDGLDVLHLQGPPDHVPLTLQICLVRSRSSAISPYVLSHGSCQRLGVDPEVEDAGKADK